MRLCDVVFWGPRFVSVFGALRLAGTVFGRAGPGCYDGPEPLTSALN